MHGAKIQIFYESAKKTVEKFGVTGKNEQIPDWAKPQPGICSYVYVIALRRTRLHLDLYLNTAGEFELHQGINRLGGRAVDVDQALVA